LDADQIGHEVLEEPAVREQLRRRWGEAVFTVDDRVNRAAVAQRVFGASENQTDELRFLEQLTHPRIRARLAAEQEQLQIEGRISGVVLDVPLLLETGWDRLCEHLIFVEVPREIRLRRALARGWTTRQFADREAAQWPLVEKRRRADTIIDNSGIREETFRQVRSCWESLRSPASRTDPN
jgi:dephospho-CoA kinase